MNPHHPRPRRVRTALAVLPLLSMGACTVSHGESLPGPTTLGHTSNGSLDVQHGWVNASPPMAGMSQEHMAAGGDAAAYARLTNRSGTPQRLVRASSPEAASVQLHQTSSSPSGSVMRRATGLTVPARGSVSLKPDGYHFMVQGLHHRLHIGDHLRLSLMFRDGTVIKVDLPVIDPTDRPTQGP